MCLLLYTAVIESKPNSSVEKFRCPNGYIKHGHQCLNANCVAGSNALHIAGLCIAEPDRVEILTITCPPGTRADSKTGQCVNTIVVN